MIIKIIQPASNDLFDMQKLAKEYVGPYGIDGASFEGHTFEFVSPTKGIWQIFVASESKEAVENLKKRQRKSKLASGVLIVGNDSPYMAAASLESLRTVSQERIGYDLRLANSAEGNMRENPLVVAIMKAQLEVVEPDGEKLIVEMHDDGLRGDKKANDGIFHASFMAEEEGIYCSTLSLRGEDPSGFVFERTVESAFQVVQDTIDVMKSAFAVHNKEHSVFDIFLPIDQNKLNGNVGKMYKVWSQVWGRGSSGKMVPVAWVSGIKEVTEREGMLVLGSLELNQRWIEKAGAKNSLQLRNLRVQDLDWSVPIEEITSLPVIMQDKKFQSDLPSLRIQEGDSLNIITLDQAEGWRTKEYIQKNSVLANVNCTLTLVHGYCAKSNPFPLSDFSNAQAFTGGLNENLSNDQFAKKIVNYIEGQSCSVAIAHSQGFAF